MSAWVQLPGSVRDLILLRRGPQDLPHSPALLAVLAAATVVLGAGLESRVMQVSDASLPALRAALMTLGLLAVIAGLLRWQGKVARFVQTATALLAIALAFDLVTAGMLLTVLPLPLKAADLNGLQLLAALASLVLLAWQLVATGHVFRHALEIPLRIGMRYALAFMLARIVLAFVIAQVAPLPAGPG